MSSNKNLTAIIDSKYLDDILNQMVDTVSESKGHIFEIGEQSRQEYENLQKELSEVKLKTRHMIERYDRLEVQAKAARGRLAEVSKHFQFYDEEDIRRTYERANNIQVELSIVQELERQLKERRNDIEKRLNSLGSTVGKADKLVSQVSVVLDYLTGDLKKMGELIEDAQEKQAFGLKIIEAQEEERKRLSREIHDGPAQLLAHVLLGSELIERVHREKGPEAANKEYKRFREMIRNALYEVRRIIYDLRPMSLDDLGLVPTLEKYLYRIQDQYPQIEFEFNSVGEERRLPSRMEAALFRLAQEAVQNACKHAKPKAITVNIEFRDKHINLLVRDNGKGFNPDQKKKENTFGLIGMKERVELLEGKMAIKSSVKSGTLIVIQIPILKEGEA
ncbi:sensor histidine kinase [Scopulibacillus cellulosilyticus]|uniref:Signal transduction histidine-protein kinase/phosphatase DegS n=1 Tax=Scopulibacillus cellulosilyticus TaxID=2665665 RepID=A0ABW2Q281_9BACL